MTWKSLYTWEGVILLDVSADLIEVFTDHGNIWQMFLYLPRNEKVGELGNNEKLAILKRWKWQGIWRMMKGQEARKSENILVESVQSKFCDESVPRR
jgi:hypothetical protein